MQTMSRPRRIALGLSLAVVMAVAGTSPVAAHTRAFDPMPLLGLAAQLALAHLPERDKQGQRQPPDGDARWLRLAAAARGHRRADRHDHVPDDQGRPDLGGEPAARRGQRADRAGGHLQAQGERPVQVLQGAVRLERPARRAQLGAPEDAHCLPVHVQHPDRLRHLYPFHRAGAPRRQRGWRAGHRDQLDLRQEHRRRALPR